MAVTTEEINKYYDFIYPLAKKAGDILMEGFQMDVNVSIKSEFYDVVTDYDHKIEEFLVNAILERYPEHKFIGEEDTAKNNNNITDELTDAPTWIIDPIDGTSNFIKKIPHTAVSIGLAINKQVVLGVINNPVMNKMYTTKLGQGAFCNGTPIKVSNTNRLNDAKVGYEVSLLHSSKIKDKHIKRIYFIGANARRLVSYGCVVDSLCMVAAGNLDAYQVEDMYPWDMAAGHLLVREAGGVITNPYGGKFDLMKPDLICACNENLRKELEHFIRKADTVKSVGGGDE